MFVVASVIIIANVIMASLMSLMFGSAYVFLRHKECRKI